MPEEPAQPTYQFAISFPVALIALGVILIGVSFLPIGQLAARSQWTPEDSAAFDKISKEYKFSTFDSHERRGLSKEEWQAEREKMKRQMLALQNKLEQAKAQPELWSRYLLGAGVVFSLTGFYLNSTSGT